MTCCEYEFLSTLSLRRATLTMADLGKRNIRFLSTLSLRRATAFRSPRIALMVDFYPRSPCGERRRRGVTCYLDNIISIHALLAESDWPGLLARPFLLQFLSTLSLRRATDARRALGFVDPISIHALLAESDGPMERGQVYYINFYPRSPCGERLVYALIFAGPMLFLSTLSLRRATPRELV